MIKVSFIAIFLAAIGYKEYNPSVVGKWEQKNGPSHQYYFLENGIVIQNHIVCCYVFQKYLLDTGSYTFNTDTLILDFQVDHKERYTIIRQNKRKLILRPVDETTRDSEVIPVEYDAIVFKRID